MVRTFLAPLSLAHNTDGRQASEAPNQKRKRGRKSNASRSSDGASHAQRKIRADGSLTTTSAAANPDNPDMEDDDVRSRKRRKSEKSAARAPASNEAADENESGSSPSRRSGRDRHPVGEWYRADHSSSPRQEQPVEAEEEEIEYERPEDKPRKRRRSSKGGGDAPETEIVENDGPEPPRPKKRGRPSKGGDAVPEGEGVETNDAQPKPQKRGRPSLNKDQVALDEDAAPKQPKKRGRPSLNREPVAEAEEGPTKQPKKRGRPSLTKETAPDDEYAPQKQPKKRGRPSLTNQRAAGDEDTPQQQPKKRGRPSLTNQRVDEDQYTPQQQPKKRGRPSLNNKRAAEGEDAPQQQPKKRGRPSLTDRRVSADGETLQQQPKKRGRPSLNGDNASRNESQRKGRRESGGQPETDAEVEPAQPRRRGRPRTSDTQVPVHDSSGDEGLSQQAYRHLITRTRRVPRSTIDSKWSALEDSSLSTVSSLLQSASRPVLLRLNNRQRQAFATSALNAVSNRLRSKLSRGMPFPPASTSGSREDELEFEKTVDGIRVLEAQLDPLLHGIDLLKREKERAEKELEREYLVLNKLSSNARAEARTRREHLRKMHVLMPEHGTGGQDDDEEVLGELLPMDKAAGAVFTDLKSKDLVGIADQISSHMESMRGNLQQIEGVSPAIMASQAALRAALQKQMGQDQVEEVVLGA